MHPTLILSTAVLAALASTTAASPLSYMNLNPPPSISDNQHQDSAVDESMSSLPEVPVPVSGLDWPSPEADYLRVQVSIIHPLFRNASGALMPNGARLIPGQVISMSNIHIRPCL